MKKKEEKIKLREQAHENEKKEQALNKYQQMIRNIINSNMIAKSRIKNRDTMISNQDVEITGLENDGQEERPRPFNRTKSQINTMQIQTRQEDERAEIRLQCSAKSPRKNTSNNSKQVVESKTPNRRIKALKAANEQAEQELENRPIRN